MLEQGDNGCQAAAPAVTMGEVDRQPRRPSQTERHEESRGARAGKQLEGKPSCYVRNVLLPSCWCYTQVHKRAWQARGRKIMYFLRDWRVTPTASESHILHEALAGCDGEPEHRSQNTEAI